MSTSFPSASPGPSWYPVFNVVTFGAAGNGVQDDAPFINNAIMAANAAGGGVVYCPAGVYLAQSVRILQHSNVRLIGAGIGATTIRQGPSANLPYVVDFFTNSANAATLEDLTVDGNAANGNTTTLCLVLHAGAVSCSNQKSIRVNGIYAPNNGFYLADLAIGTELDSCTTDSIFAHCIALIPLAAGTPTAQKFSYNATIRNPSISALRGGFGIIGELADDVTVIAPNIAGYIQKCVVNISAGGVMTFVSGIIGSGSGWNGGMFRGLQVVWAPNVSSTIGSAISTTQVQLISYTGGAVSGVTVTIGSFEGITLWASSRWRILGADINGGIDAGITCGLQAAINTAVYNGNAEDCQIIGGSIRNTGNDSILFASTDRPGGQINILRNYKAIGVTAGNCNLNSPNNGANNDVCFRMVGDSVFDCTFTACRAIDDTGIGGLGSTSAFGMAFDSMTPSQGNSFSDFISLNTLHPSVRNLANAASPIDYTRIFSDAAGNAITMQPTQVVLSNGTVAGFYGLTAWGTSTIQFLTNAGVPTGVIAGLPVYYFRKDGSAGAHLYFNPGSGSSTWTAIA
ncbi:MAG: mannuronan epimerase [Candidatus Eremiobacteraeota bacterium]|nr:mannuronan epimerase [Candidatus Eremiobacteraeota bacterium]